jgi:hypothetical protein
VHLPGALADAGRVGFVAASTTALNVARSGFAKSGAGAVVMMKSVSTLTKRWGSST